MRPVPIDDLPEELRLRVLAATGEPQYLTIHEESLAPDADHQYLVEGITGDRVTVMRLSTRADGSVAEATDSFVVTDLFAVVIEEGEAELVLKSPDQGPTMSVTPEMAAAVISLRRGEPL